MMKSDRHMPLRVKLSALFLLLCWTAPVFAQEREGRLPDVRLPDGRLQRDAILKADHDKNLEDAAKLVKAAEDLRIAIEKGDPHVLSLGAVKQTEEIEKIARRIRTRMKK
jgi:hypothetical protein